MEPGTPLSALSVAPSQVSPDGGADGTPPDVVIGAGEKCSVSAERLNIIKERARAILHMAYEAGFGHLPIDRGDLISRTLSLINEASICRSLVTPSGADEKNHNKLRNKYKSGSLASAEAPRRGVGVSSVPLKIACPPKYDWKNSFFYTNADKCKDVTDTFPKDGMPTAMYSVQMPAEITAGHLSGIKSSSYYTKYAGAGPAMCKQGPNYVDAYHEVWVSSIWPNLKFVQRGIHGENWAAWHSLRSCRSNTRSYSASDLMFSFGVRVFIPVDVERDGRRDQHTIVMTQAASAPNGFFAGLLSAKYRFESFVGREFAKKLFLEAKAKGWKVEK